jgi:hypothetical protein
VNIIGAALPKLIVNTPQCMELSFHLVLDVIAVHKDIAVYLGAFRKKE